jgi:hypothetical protein
VAVTLSVPGPPMTLGNMRSLGVRLLTVMCELCHHVPHSCYVTADGKLAGEARHTYKKLDDRMAIVIFRPEEYQGRSDVVLYAMFDFAEAKDRAVLLAGGKKCDTRAFLLSARV